ncbi:hypothetical protein SDC9_105008 [bioreactor metagenome]|uniref:PIN domain-containing protein n=1 Tax=bioreactor metagenome TaxID=1076179 RepID=A0A645AYI1_9ZZZZ
MGANLEFATGTPIGFRNFAEQSALYSIQAYRQKQGAGSCANREGLFAMALLDEKILRRSVDFPHKDFEDAIHFQSAIRVGTDCVINRDANLFPKDELPLLSPGEFLELTS